MKLMHVGGANVQVAKCPVVYWLHFYKIYSLNYISHHNITIKLSPAGSHISFFNYTNILIKKIITCEQCYAVTETENNT
jgi:hypothetical protein